MTGGERGRVGRIVVAFAILVGSVAPVVGPAAAASVGDGPATVEGVAGTDGVTYPAANGPEQREPPSGNNTTVAHRNPEELSGESSPSGAERWLARELTGRLSRSIDLSRQDSERARRLIANDSEYAELAERYAEVTGAATGSSGDANRSAGGNASTVPPVVVGAIQRAFLDDVQRYRETLRAYRTARERNRTVRTRRLAHKLERRLQRINRTATLLNRSYANLSTSRPSERRNVTRTIGELRANVTRTQMTVRDQTLVRTRLSVRAVEANGSFTDPAVVAGRLRTANGTPVAAENVTLRFGNQTANVTTDRRGRFRVHYRPTLAATGTHRRTVSFRPANDSVYLRANATVRLGIRQVTPNLSVTTRTETVRYDETFGVEGSVAAGGVGVPDVPVVVTIDDDRVARVRTAPNGSFGASIRFPANVSAGGHRVGVRLALANASRRVDGARSADALALAPTTASVRFTVERTPTSLSIAEIETGNETAFVGGRLTTADGEPLANQTVAVRLDGTLVGTTRTDATGRYGATVTVPSRLVGETSPVRVVATSPASGSLGAARANATVTLSSSGATAPDWYLELGVVGLLGVVLVGVFAWRFRSASESGFEGETTGDGLVRPGVERGRSPDDLLAAASGSLDDGRFDEATVAAYAAARRRLDRAAVDRGTQLTHWEFLDACRDAELSEARLARVERLTRVYERAAFAAESVTEDEAVRAVETATALVERAREGGDSGAGEVDGDEDVVSGGGSDEDVVGEGGAGDDGGDRRPEEPGDGPAD